VDVCEDTGIGEEALKQKIAETNILGPKVAKLVQSTVTKSINK